MNSEDVREFARLILNGQTRSHVEAARILAEYVLGAPNASVPDPPSRFKKGDRVRVVKHHPHEGLCGVVLDVETSGDIRVLDDQGDTTPWDPGSLESAATPSSSPIPSELFPLAVRIEKGRQKYPNGCTVLSLLDEAGEVAHAVNKYEAEARIREELLDVAVVAMRLYFGEIDRGLEIDGLVQRRKVEESVRSKCSRCGGDGWIRCKDAECAECAADRYCCSVCGVHQIHHSRAMPHE